MCIGMEPSLRWIDLRWTLAAYAKSVFFRLSVVNVKETCRLLARFVRFLLV